MRRPERHAKILEAAAQIFNERGYLATSVQDVADAAGILKGSVYYYIDSKEDLLAGVVQQVHERSLMQLAEAKTVQGDVFERLRAFIEGHAVFNMRNTVEIGVFLHELRNLKPERRAQIVRERDLYDTYLRELITEGQQRGVIHSDVDAKITATGILGMMNWSYQWYRPDGPASPERIAREWANLVLRGLRVTDPDLRS